jgi:hypothetical protein
MGVTAAFLKDSTTVKGRPGEEAACAIMIQKGAAWRLLPMLGILLLAGLILMLCLARTPVASASTVIKPLKIRTSSLPTGTVGSRYSRSLVASGGTLPYNWTIRPGTGSLPAGLRLNRKTGAITGTPRTTETSKFTVRVTDASSPSQSATARLSIRIESPLKITPTSLDEAATGVRYRQTVLATGGTKPYTWSITSGSLPRGLTLSRGTGTIRGIALTTGTSSFTISVTDSDTPTAHTASLSTSITVVEQVSFSEPTPSVGIAGQPYPTLAPRHVSGGSGSYTWSITKGKVPAGLNLDTGTGTISGTIDSTAELGPDNFTITLADANNPSLIATEKVTIKVVGPLSVAIPTQNATAITSFSKDLAPFVSGGVAPYTFSAASADGLSVDSGTGRLSGTPDATCVGGGLATVIPGTSTIKVACPATTVPMTVTVTDADGTTATALFTVDVSVTPLVFTPVSALPDLPDDLSYDQQTLVNGIQPTGGYGPAISNVGGISFSTSKVSVSGPGQLPDNNGLPCNQGGCVGSTGAGELTINSSNGEISGLLHDVIIGQEWVFNVNITDADPLNPSNSMKVSFLLSIAAS